MRKVLYAFFITTLLFASSCVNATGSNSLATIVPLPSNVEFKSGTFPISQSVSFGIVPDSLITPVNNFIESVQKFSGVVIPTGNTKKSDIHLDEDKTIPAEGYNISVTPKQVSIAASDRNGFIYAFQTLRQLLEKENGKSWIPCVEIKDSPRFGYRGMMMDVSRYFVPKAEMLKLIDVMESLKLNKLHWHLTDDNGWRIEIKQYPELTKVGAWRVDREDLPFPARRNPKPSEPTPIGGFYTQDDIREIVNYANERGIEVIPEIDMPAHANSALAAYPQYACPVVDKFIGVLPGIGGDNADIIYCAGNDSVFVFLQNILDEVIDLFPSKYIHLGGDEAWKTNWDKCPLCQKRIKEEKLENSEELQGWFMTRMSDYVRSKGREVIGWDELVNSRLPEDAVIMGWQGNGNRALKAAAQGHNFILTPAQLMYFIRYQGPQWFEPATYFAGGSLKDVYEFEPVKDNWEQGYEDLLLGVQGSMWNEFSHNEKDVEYQLFPRLIALAEVAWRPKEISDWEGFIPRLDAYLPLLDEMGVTYANSMYNIQQTIVPQNGNLNVSLECIRPDVEIRYTVDGSEPTPASQLYTGPFDIDNKTAIIRAITFKDGTQKGQLLDIPVSWHKGTGKNIVNARKEEPRMLNGVSGSIKQTDLEWCSWDDCSNVEFTVDLGKKDKVDIIELGFINNYGMAVHRPKSVDIYISDDNEHFVPVGHHEYNTEEIFAEGNFIHHENFALNGNETQYIRVNLKGPGACPKEHVRPGKEVKVYIDEVTVK